MNRLSPLIDRHPRAAIAITLARSASRAPERREEQPGWLQDAKLFGASYLAGMVVFSTFLA